MPPKRRRERRNLVIWAPNLYPSNLTKSTLRSFPIHQLSRMWFINDAHIRALERHDYDTANPHIGEFEMPNLFLGAEDQRFTFPLHPAGTLRQRIIQALQDGKKAIVSAQRGKRGFPYRLDFNREFYPGRSEEKQRAEDARKLEQELASRPPLPRMSVAQMAAILRDEEEKEEERAHVAETVAVPAETVVEFVEPAFVPVPTTPTTPVLSPARIV